MKKWIFIISSISTISFAQDETAVLNAGHTAWMMMSTALVFLMTPIGLALFYSGMTRVKNVLNTYLMVFTAFSVAFIAWIVAGYSIAFGEIEGVLNQYIGGLSHVMLSGINWNDLAADSGQTYPKLVFIVFQGTFAAITIAIAAGSVIERIKFSTWVVFVSIWTVFVYSPIVHMVWGGGYLANEGALDFAGGTVVHMNGGLAGFVLAILVGKRSDYSKVAMKPASIVLTAVGAGLLWFGWYGFNGGSAFGANEIAGLAYLTTTVATSLAALVWLIMESLIYKKTTLLGAASGAIAGLVSITPAAGFVDARGAIIIGAIGSFVAFYGVTLLKKKLKYDDSLDAFGIHFISGMWGAIATGIFALNDKELLWDGPLKDSDNRLSQVFIQFESIIIVGLYTLIGTIVVYFISSVLTKGGRVNDEDESQGLDESVHGERGFNL